MAGLPVAAVTPRQVRDFAKAEGQRAKSDALDAQLLARFAEAVQPPPGCRWTSAQQELTALLGRRRQLVGMLTAERQRRGTALPAVQARVRAHVRWLGQELAALDDWPGLALRARPACAARPGAGLDAGAAGGVRRTPGRLPALQLRPLRRPGGR